MTETYTRFVKKYKDYFSRLKRQNSRQIMSHVTQISDHESEQLNRILHSFMLYVYYMLLYTQNHQTSLILYNVYIVFFLCQRQKRTQLFVNFYIHFLPNGAHGDAQQQTLLPPRRPTKRRTGLPVLFRHALAPRVPPPPHRTGVLPQEISWSGCSASNHAHVATDHDGFFGDAGMFWWVMKSGVATKPNTNSGAAHRGGSLGGSVRRLLPHRSPRRCSRTTTNTHAGRRP